MGIPQPGLPPILAHGFPCDKPPEPERGRLPSAKAKASAGKSAIPLRPITFDAPELAALRYFLAEREAEAQAGGDHRCP
jgi:hypothetical protein